MENEKQLEQNNVDNVSSETMSDLMNEIDKSFKKINQGDIMKGKVISVSEDEVLVDIGYCADGLVPLNEITYDTVKNINDIIKVGDEIDVMVVNVDDGEGNVLLSKKRAEEIVVWDELQEIYEQEKIVDVIVKEVVKGGVVAYYKGVRAFIPASHISLEYIDDLNNFINIKLSVKLIDFNTKNRKVVFSRKIVELKEKHDKKVQLFKTIEKGKKYKGKVKKLVNFGAFVDIGGVDGLIHINDLSWKRIKHPSEVVNEGDVVEVYIIDVDANKEKIALGLKDIKEDPWGNIDKHYKTGQIVEGIVTRLVAFGAFVELETGIEGLVHISKILERRIIKCSEVLEEGQNVKVKILKIDKGQKRMSLSIKEAINETSKVEIPDEYKSDDNSMATFGDVLKNKFKGLDLD